MSRRQRITGTLSLATLALVLVGGQPGWTSPMTGVGPAEPGAPDLDALLRRTIEQVKRDREAEEQFQASYAFTRMKVTETRDGSGTLTKRTEEQIMNPRPAGEIPNPGDEEDLDHTDQATAKRPYERRDFKVDAALLERFRFALAGAESIEGRATWVVDFEPASDRLPARSLKDRFINRTAGRLWIDQEEAALTRAEFRLTTPISVAGGLVGALKSCAAHLERQRTPDGLWYPRLVTWEIEGRKFFSTRRMEHRDEITDVRPLGQLGRATARPEDP